MARLTKHDQSALIVTRRTMKDGKVIYFPRTQAALRKLYAIDTIRCGFTRSELSKRFTIVDTDDNIIED
jgi:hypothetical protein